MKKKKMFEVPERLANFLERYKGSIVDVGFIEFKKGDVAVMIVYEYRDVYIEHTGRNEVYFPISGDLYNDEFKNWILANYGAKK